MIVLPFALLLAAQSSPAPLHELGHELALPPVPVVVEHRGDPELFGKLVATMEVWYDAGNFLVGQAQPEFVAGLERRKIGVTTLESLQASDGLFVVDLARPDVRAGVDRAARLLYRKGDQALVAVPVGLESYPDGLTPGHTCHSGHVWITRRAMKPAAPATWRGVPATPGALALTGADPRVQALVNQVVKTNLSTTDQALASNFSRLSTNNTYVDTARDQIEAQLQGYGYTTTRQAVAGTQGDNVIVQIPGTVKPNRYVVIGAHYDSINGNGAALTAPGADDNATGSSAVLEIARILHGAGPFENSVRMIWFCGEEQGLLGSDVNAQSSLAGGQQIIAMLNTDMNAFRQPADVRDCDFATNNTSATLTSFCQATSALYVTPWATTQGVLTAGSSDHASYNSHGFPAAFFFEDLTQFSPYIHTANDTYPSSTNDFDLSLMITRAIVACAATLAEPVDMVITHTPLGDTTDATGPYSVIAQVTSANGANVTSATLRYSSDGGQNYTAALMSANGSTYTGAIPTQGSPVTIRYYIEAQDDQGGSEVLPEGADAGATPFSFFVGTKTVIYSTGFEGASDAGWTHALVVAQDDWQRGTPAGTAGDPSAAYAGTKIWGNDLGPMGWNGAYANGVENYLRSPLIDCSAATSVTLEFQRWLTIESGQFDQAQIRVNNAVVWQNPTLTDLIDGAWTKFSLDISAQAAGNAAVRIEFRLISDGGLTFGGWNIDEFSLVELGPGTTSCPTPSAYCTAKTNSLGCTPAVSFSGAPSLTDPNPFLVTASQVLSNKQGLLFYGYVASATPFQGGTKCVGGSTKRSPLQDSAGNAPPTDCSGTFSYDFNARIQSGGDPGLVFGAVVFAQYWSRDSGDPSGFGTNLTNALQFTVCQ